MQKTVRTLLACALSVGFAHTAAAQNSGWGDRAYINVGFGVESGDTDLKDSKTFGIYEETATVNSASAFTSGSLFDVAVGVKVWKNLSVGAAYHQETNTADAELTGSVPHPIFFNSARSFTEKAVGLERRENAEHMVIGWTTPIGSKLDVMVFAGPSWFRLQQGVISDIKASEQGSPFTQVLIAATRETRKKSVMGYHAGADISYLAWQNDSIRLGGGVFFRYAAAKTNVLMLTNETETTVGGIQFGFGGRVRF